MRVEAKEFYNAYNALREDASFKHAGSVSIFVSDSDCDSLCALRIFERLLELDSVLYSRFAVSGYDDLQRYADKWQEEGDEPRAVMLINCGGGEDARGLFGLDNLPSTRLFIVDAHRPLHHKNLEANESQVFVFHNKEEDGEDMDFEGLSSDESESEDEESDAESDASERSKEDGSEREESEGDAGTARRRQVDDEGAPPHLRRKTNANKSVGRHRKQSEIRKRRAQYYSRGSFYGMAAGCLMYELASLRLHKDVAELLWLSILSLTDQHIHDRIGTERYTARVMALEQNILSLRDNDAENMPPTQTGDDIPTTRIPHVDTIACEEDYRFMLLRHWSLLEAMMNSSYIAAHLRTWSDEGRELVMELLARVGLPLKDCRQKYSHMPPQLKKLLDKKLPDLAEAMQLEGLRFMTFRRYRGYKLDISAVDVVYAITALLEQGNADDDDAMDRLTNASRAIVSMNDLEAGIRLSMRVQKTIVQYGGLSLSRGEVHAVPGFFYINLTETAASDAKLLAHPLRLTRLASFLQESLIAAGRAWRPVIVIGPDIEGSVAVVGVKGKPRVSDSVGNTLGLAFRSAADKTKSHFSQDRFDTCIIELARDDVDRFMRIVTDEIQISLVSSEP